MGKLDTTKKKKIIIRKNTQAKFESINVNLSTIIKSGTIRVQTKENEKPLLIGKKQDKIKSRRKGPKLNLEGVMLRLIASGQSSIKKRHYLSKRGINLASVSLS